MLRSFNLEALHYVNKHLNTIIITGVPSGELFFKTEVQVFFK